MSVKIEVRSRRYPDVLFGWLIFNYMPEQKPFKLACLRPIPVAEASEMLPVNTTIPVVDLDWGRRITARGREIPFLRCSIDDLPHLMLRDNFRPVRT